MAHYTIGQPLWDSFHSYLIGRSNSLKRRPTGSQQSLISDGRSGIRLIDETGKAQRGGVSIDRHTYRGGRPGVMAILLVDDGS